MRDTLLETSDGAGEAYAQQRMRDMLELIELSTGWFDEVQRLSPGTLLSLMKRGSKVQKMLDFAGKLRGNN